MATLREVRYTQEAPCPKLNPLPRPAPLPNATTKGSDNLLTFELGTRRMASGHQWSVFVWLALAIHVLSQRAVLSQDMQVRIICVQPPIIGNGCSSNCSRPCPTMRFVRQSPTTRNRSSKAFTRTSSKLGRSTPKTNSRSGPALQCLANGSGLKSASNVSVDNTRQLHTFARNSPRTGCERLARLKK